MGWVDSATIIRLAIATFFAAIIRQTVRDYWGWRNRRLALPYDSRNAGFLTDTKLRIFEIGAGSAIALLALSILGFVVWAVGVGNSWWEPYWPL